MSDFPARDNTCTNPPSSQTCAPLRRFPSHILTHSRNDTLTTIDVGINSSRARSFKDAFPVLALAAWHQA
jgi:hypothetical protein